MEFGLSDSDCVGFGAVAVHGVLEGAVADRVACFDGVVWYGAFCCHCSPDKMVNLGGRMSVGMEEE